MITTKKIQLLVADDHAILRDGIVSLLKTEKDFQVACTAAGGYEALDLISKHKVDVCLLDINMPG
ncbi:MAG: response regulator transcription factor, partial [Chitinophagaceae bacterium]|nr:response regulator transcription factor [Chitinophagaceae bacterium]